MVISFVCLVPVRLLLSSMKVLYHVNGQLQRAFFSLSPVTVPDAFAKVNSTQFPFSTGSGGWQNILFLRLWGKPWRYINNVLKNKQTNTFLGSRVWNVESKVKVYHVDGEPHLFRYNQLTNGWCHPVFTCDVVALFSSLVVSSQSRVKSS